MTRFIIRAEVTITYEYDLEADTLEEALALVEDDEVHSSEIDSTAPTPIAYTIEGQMGWNQIRET